MKKISFCFAIALIACNTSEKSAEKVVTEIQLADTASVAITDKTIIAESGSNCVRDVPVAIVKINAFPKMSFELQPNKQVGIETIDLENGDKVIIKNWGCNYYALTFRFETSRFQSEPTNIPFWYKRTVTLLNELTSKIEAPAPIDIERGTDRLMNKIEEEVPNGYQNLAFNKELDFANGLRSFVCIDK